MWRLITKTSPWNSKIKYDWNQYTIELLNDSFWPYLDIFTREDCYFNELVNDRWTIEFPLKWKKFNNTEIFLETDDIIVASWVREWLGLVKKSFIDIVNLKTEKKQRFLTDEVNLIFNSADKIVLNANINWDFKTIVLDFNSLQILEEKEEELLAFFKGIYNVNTKERLILDFFPSNENEKDFIKKYQNGYFVMKQIKSKYWDDTKLQHLLLLWYWEPKEFDRQNCIVKVENWIFDPWAISNNL
jgi:hypothetical protein